MKTQSKRTTFDIDRMINSDKVISLTRASILSGLPEHHLRTEHMNGILHLEQRGGKLYVNKMAFQFWLGKRKGK